MTVLAPALRQRRVALLPGAAHAERASLLELAALAGFGAVTAVARAVLDLHLGLPGHSIVLVVPFLALGLSCVPRRRGGILMGISALGFGGALGAAGVGGRVGMGALTSMFVTAMLLEGALRLARSGAAIYLACTLAGVLSNTAAFGMRLVGKLLVLTPAEVRHPLELWWPRAAWTYPLCGAVAGLLSAWLLFKLRDSAEDEP